MALKAKVANKVTTNDKGLVEGTITQVLEIEERYQDAKGGYISKDVYFELKQAGKKPVRFDSQFQFEIESEGSQKSISYRIWTGQTFNNEKHEKSDKSEDYNTFTRLMLQLEVITENDLKDLSNPKLSDFDVDSVEGLKISFELEPSKNAKGLKSPKLLSIKPLKVK